MAERDRQRWPKAIFGPNGEEVVVQDAQEELAQLEAWRARMSAPEPSVDAIFGEPERRGPGRPRKVA